MGIISTAQSTRRAFRNWPIVAVVGGLVLPSALPPRSGIPALARRRITFRTRLGPVLTTEIANASPIIEVFRDEPYAIPINWSAVRLVFDVGSHVGAFATWAAQTAPSATIVAFEAEPRNAQDLRANVARNGFSSRIRVHEIALGATDGERVLYVPDDRDTASLSPDVHGRSVTVACRRLDNFLREEVDLLKIDCEGAEREILDSVSRDSWQRVRHIVLEVHGRREHEIEEVTGILTDAGYRMTSLAGGHATAVFPVVQMLWAERG